MFVYLNDRGIDNRGKRPQIFLNGFIVNIFETDGALEYLACTYSMKKVENRRFAGLMFAIIRSSKTVDNPSDANACIGFTSLKGKAQSSSTSTILKRLPDILIRIIEK